jgi:hypothetical protein
VEWSTHLRLLWKGENAEGSDIIEPGDFGSIRADVEKVRIYVVSSRNPGRRMDSEIQIAVLVTIGRVGEDSCNHPTISAASKKDVRGKAQNLAGNDVNACRPPRPDLNLQNSAARAYDSDRAHSVKLLTGLGLQIRNSNSRRYKGAGCVAFCGPARRVGQAR